MRISRRDMLVAPAIGVMWAGQATGDEKKDDQPLEGVLKQWSPNLKSATAFTTIGGEKWLGEKVRAVTFVVEGVKYGELVDHYAVLCGMKERAADDKYLASGGKGANGRYQFVGHLSLDGKGGVEPTPAMFVLDTDNHLTSVTFMPDPDGKRIKGTLLVVIR